MIPLPRRTFLHHSAIALAAATAGRAATAGSPARPRLIVRGDDMGYAHGGNLALIQCAREGIETAIEVIAPAPWFPEAVRLLREHATIDVGVHLCLTSEWDNVKWRPLSACPSLVDTDGFLRPMVHRNPQYPGQSIVENRWQLADIEREFRAQIELVRKHVPRVSHVTGHMGCTRLAPEVAALTRRLARAYGVDIDLDELGVKTVRYAGPKTTSAEKKASFLAMLATLEPGQTYCFVDHPGLDGPELRAIHHRGYEDVARDRQGVTDTWTDPEVKAFIRDRGIVLIGYRDLRA